MVSQRLDNQGNAEKIEKNMEYEKACTVIRSPAVVKNCFLTH